jgi:ribosomal-protein-alanine N-acetyltransferase
MGEAPRKNWIHTARLRLRPYRTEDLDAVHRILATPEVRHFLLDGEVVSRAWVAQEIETSIATFRKAGYGQWTITLRSGEDGLIGLGGFRPFPGAAEPQLFYALRPAIWGRGLATEAAQAMIAYAFDVLGWERVAASADPPNAASVRVLEKSGLRLDRRATRADGREIVHYAVDRRAGTGRPGPREARSAAGL